VKVKVLYSAHWLHNTAVSGTTDDVWNLKCEACMLSVTVLFCVVYGNNFNRSIILLGFLPAQHFRNIFKDASLWLMYTNVNVIAEDEKLKRWKKKTPSDMKYTPYLMKIG